MNYPDVRGMARNLWFFDHNYPEQGDDSEANNNPLSHVNNFEAEMVVELATRLIRHGYTSTQIAVLTPYSGQLLKLRELFMHRNMAVYLDERTVRELQDLDVDIEGEEGEEEESSQKTARKPTVVSKNVGHLFLEF